VNQSGSRLSKDVPEAISSLAGFLDVDDSRLHQGRGASSATAGVNSVSIVP